MKTVASQEILASSCGNESVAMRQLHIILTTSFMWVALPVAIYSLPFSMRTPAWNRQFSLWVTGLSA